MADHRVKTCLGTLHVTTEGAGPPVVFWGSLLMSGAMWSAQAAHLSDRYRVVRIDPPGHGRSDPLSRGFRLDECARCVVETLDALGMARAHIVGSSWGGMVAGCFAAAHPDRAGALVLVSATASPAGVRQRVEFAVLVTLLGLFARMPAPLKATAVRAFIGPTTERSRPQVVQRLQAALGEVNPRSVRWAVRSVVPDRPDLRARFGQIQAPVLVVAGAEDRTFPVAEVRTLAASIPGAVYQELADAAHLAALECPERINQLVGDWLDRHPALVGPPATTGIGLAA